MAEGTCELCGRFSNLSQRYVEGVPLQICSNCRPFSSAGSRSPAQLKAIHASVNKSTLNKKINQFKKAESKRKSRFDLESGQQVVDNYSDIFRKLIQKNKMTNIEFAKKFAQKESYISQIVLGKIRPSLALCKKIEALYKVDLIENFDSSKESSFSHTTSKGESFDEGMTIGDLIKIKVRKK